MLDCPDADCGGVPAALLLCSSVSEPITVELSSDELPALLLLPHDEEEEEEELFDDDDDDDS